MVIKIENSLNCSDEYPIFLSENYLKTESKEYGWITCIIDNKIIAILPYYVYTRYIFRLLRFTTETYFTDNQLRDKYEQDFLNNLVKKVEELNIDIIIQPTTNVVFNKYPNNSIYAPFATYKINLTLSQDELWNNLHSKHRNVIRNAEKKGIKVYENDYNIDEIYNLIKSTFVRSSMSFMSLEKFIGQIKNLGKNIKIFVAKTEDGTIQGCAIIPFNHYSGYYLHGGSIKRPLTGAMNFLQWKIILSLKKENILRYDFVGARVNVKKGTKLEGIQKFKERFGANMHIGYMWKYPIKPWKYKLFNIIYKLLKKSEGDIIDQERNR